MSKNRNGSETGDSAEGESSGERPPGGAGIPGRIELFATVFVTGAVVMVVEILGTRIIGPVFGVGLFVWAALLAVTLASLAGGYYFGGVLIDRTPNQRLLSLAVLLAGAVLGLVPVVSRVVLRAAESLGPRGGPLLSATILFAPCLLLLGMVGPIAVRLVTANLRDTGHRVGSIYAVSTAGSLLGTLVTAFLLIPALDTKHILFGTASLLTLLGAIPLAMRGRAGAIAAILVPGLALAVPSPNLSNGIKVVERSQSLYGLLEVIDDPNRGVRLLRADHSIIGGKFTRDHSPSFAFVGVLESIRFLRPNAKDLLEIGLGIGSLPVALRSSKIKVDVVEIDPEVVRLARRHFGFSATGEVHVEDARTFLRRTERRYDLIVHDTFTGGSTPEHLLSLEVLLRIKEILRPGGVLALNFAGYQQGAKAAASFAVARTIREVFATVRSFRDMAPDDRPDAPTNLIFFASDSTLDFSVLENAHLENSTAEKLLHSFSNWEVLRNVPDGPLITDNLNPLARLQIPIAEEHFAAMNELLPPEVWLP